MAKLKLVGGTAVTPKVWPPMDPAAWARVELSALATIEDAARRSRAVPEVFPHVFIPPRLRAVYTAVEKELEFWTLTQHDRSTALRYYWLGLIMATVTLHPPWWSALNKILVKLTREEKSHGRNSNGSQRGRRRPRATRRTARRPGARRVAHRRGA